LKDWRESERLLRKFVDAWGGRPLAEIKRADVHRVLDGIVSSGAPVGANRALARFRKMCSWAVSRELIEHNPCDGVDAPTVEKSRDRVLDSGELSLVWKASGVTGFPFGPIVRVLILTGQRRSEVSEMEWSEIDLDRALWTLPASRTKNGRPHTLPLSQQVLEILNALPCFSGSGFVFSSGEKSPSGYSNAKERLDKAVAALNGGESIPPWGFHDIRRSVASGMAAEGVNLPVIERCLNHVSGSFAGIVGVYQRHNFADEMRAAMDLWGRRVDRLAGGDSSRNIIEFGRIGGDSGSVR
jgi:integrase